MDALGKVMLVKYLRYSHAIEAILYHLVIYIYRYIILFSSAGKNSFCLIKIDASVSLLSLNNPIMFNVCKLNFSILQNEKKINKIKNIITIRHKYPNEFI